MPTVDFDNVDDADDYSPLPEGRYLCRLTEINGDKTTQKGAEMWALTWEVTQEEHWGRRIWDNLIFAGKPLSRVKVLCRALGIPIEGPVNLTPDLMLGKYAYVDVAPDEYINTAGETKKKSAVTWTGYSEAEGVEQPASNAEGEATGADDTPF